MKHFNDDIIHWDSYILARKELIGRVCHNCMNSSCSIRGKGMKQIDDCSGWENPNLQKKAVILHIYDIEVLQNISIMRRSILTDLEYEIQKKLKRETDIKKIF